MEEVPRTGTPLGLSCALRPDGVVRIGLHRVSVPLVTPLVSSHGVETTRNSTIVEVELSSGEIGWGECVALTRPTYTAEWAEGAWLLLSTEAVPMLLAGHGDAVRGHPMARFALETALSDARLRSAGQTLISALGGVARPLERTAVLGRPPSIDALVTAAAASLAGGASVVKIKVGPGWDREPAEALRAAFATARLAADANGAYCGTGSGLSWADFSWADDVGLEYLEQPLAADDLIGHARLVRDSERCRIALDESIESIGVLDAALALDALSAASCKPARLGGLDAAATMVRRCAAARVPVHVGGMVELGIGRAAALAIACLEGVSIPTDLGPSGSYVDEDVCTEIRCDEHGRIVPPDGPGLGIEIDRARLGSVTVASLEFRP